MSNYIQYDKLKCFGCGSCEAICPHNCIDMHMDSEGFYYPNFNNEQCTQCGLCKSHCPIIAETKNEKILATYGLIHKEKSVTDDSASGGAFTAFAEYILALNGVVYGCAFNDNMEAVTYAVEKIDDLHILRGSKYIQCYTNKQYIKIKGDLEKGKYVLYCATPCQIAGLKSYLNKDYDKLILIDLFCHGVPSPGLFRKYIGWLSKKYKGKITEYSFRDKCYGWGTQGHFKADKDYVLYGSDPYYYSFLTGRTYRSVCYNCMFSSAARTGDISIGDYWGIEKKHSEIQTDKGVSAVLINTKKGMNIFNNIKDRMIFFETTFNDIAENNEQLIHPTKKYDKRDIIYKYYNKWSFKKLANKYLYIEPLIILKLKKFTPKFLKNLIRKLKK